jgi:hypothetical protein
MQGRDLLSIYNKLAQVLYPMRKGAGREVLRSVAGRKFHERTTRLTFFFAEIGTSGDRSFSV